MFPFKSNFHAKLSYLFHDIQTCIVLLKADMDFKCKQKHIALNLPTSLDVAGHVFKTRTMKKLQKKS